MRNEDPGRKEHASASNPHKPFVHACTSSTVRHDSTFGNQVLARQSEAHEHGTHACDVHLRKSDQSDCIMIVTVSEVAANDDCRKLGVDPNVLLSLKGGTAVSTLSTDPGGGGTK